MADQNQAAARLAREQAEAEIAEARTEADGIVKRAEEMKQSLRDELLSAAEADKDRIIAQAKDEIEAERNRAVMELRSRAGEVVIDAAREVLQRTVDERVDRGIVARALVDEQAGGAA
jgi:F-type H+-transporting ATPase subunit b